MKQFEQLVDFVDCDKSAMKVVKGTFVLSFLYNFVGIGFAVQGLLSPILAAILMPLSSITVVVFGVLGSNWVARKWRMNNQELKT